MRSGWGSLARQALRVVLVLAIGAGAWLLVTVSPGSKGTQFLSSSQARLWVLIITVQAGLWAALVPYLIHCCRVSAPAARGRLRVAVIGVVGVIALVSLVTVTGPLGSGFSYPVAHHHGRTQVLTIAGLIVTSPGLLAMWLMRERLAEMSLPAAGEWPLAARQASDLLALRDRLARVLLALGLAVGAATLSTGALRAAVLASHAQSAAQVPAIGPWLFGAWATLLLSVFYFPAYLELQKVSLRLANVMYPLDWPGQPGTGWYDERTAFTTLLKLDLGPLQAFRTGIAVLGPLLGSLLGLLLPVGK